MSQARSRVIKIEMEPYEYDHETHDTIMNTYTNSRGGSMGDDTV